MKVAIFLGPSLSVAEARREWDEPVYLPPVAMGDLYGAVHSGRYSAIGIVDGVFEQVPSVYHKEILFALTSGIPVYGSSSMGALRAAELHAFGMQGVGRIFEAYRDGVLEDDDEVAIAHGPASEGFRPLSEAMVNLREGLRLARADDVIGAGEFEALVAGAKETFYAERTWDAVRRRAVELGLDAATVRRLMEYRRPGNLKGLDALALIRTMKAKAESFASRAPAPPFVLEETIFWERLADECRRRPGAAGDEGGGRVTQEAIRARALAAEADRRDLLRLALLEELAKTEVRRLNMNVDAATVQSAADAFRRRHGLQSAEALATWLRSSDLDPASFADLMICEAKEQALLQHYGTLLHPGVVLELKRRGRYDRLAAEVQKVEQLLESKGIERPTLDDVGLDERELFTWYERKYGASGVTIGECARGLGFEAQIDFVSELARLYVVDGAASKPTVAT
jgi:hypothetical protein